MCNNLAFFLEVFMNNVKFCRFILFLICIFQCNSVFASNKIYILKSCADYGLRGAEEMCIVADTNEWECKANGNNMITGNSRPILTSFIFHIDSFQDFYYHKTHEVNKKMIMLAVEKYLVNYARITNTVFSSVFIKEINNGCYIVNGSYFDNSSSGTFALKVEKIRFNDNSPMQGTSYVMLVMIRENLRAHSFDDETRENLYQETFNLITHLCSYK